MIEFAKKLKSLNKFNVELEGNPEDIIENPREWAKRTAEQSIIQNIPRYLKAKKLGKEFADELKNKN